MLKTRITTIQISVTVCNDLLPLKYIPFTGLYLELKSSFSPQNKLIDNIVIRHGNESDHNLYNIHFLGSAFCWS